jgi:hypothetical protein
VIHGFVACVSRLKRVPAPGFVAPAPFLSEHPFAQNKSLQNFKPTLPAFPYRPNLDLDQDSAASRRHLPVQRAQYKLHWLHFLVRAEREVIAVR